MPEIVPAQWVKKDWGRKRTLYQDGQVVSEEAEIVAGGTSSRHYHAYNYNDFFVLDGELTVLIYIGDTDEVRYARDLRRGDKLTVSPGIWHRFRADTDVRLLEFYWREKITTQDIIRADE